MSLLPNSRAPTIPKSSDFKTDETRFLKVDEITDGTFTLSEGTLTGLSDPTISSGAATKNYVDTSFTFKTNKTSQDVSGEGVTYTGSQLMDGIIVRTPTTASLDTFPTVSQIVTAMGSNGHLGNFFDIMIINDVVNDAFPNNPYITIDFSDLNYVGNANNPRINPESLAIFRIIITNATSGSETADVYLIQNSYYQDLGDVFYKAGTSFRMDDPMRIQELVYNRVPVSGVATTIEGQSRVIQTSLSPTSALQTLQMPDYTEIISALGLTTNAVKQGDTFLFTVHTNTNGNGTTANSYQITQNTGVFLDTNSSFIIGDNIYIEPKQHNSATYAAVADSNAGSRFTVYSLYKGIYSQLFTNIDWVTQTTTQVPSGFRWEDVAWSPTIGGGTFAAVATKETTATASIGAVMTSTDGVNWTTQAGIADVYWTAITWNPDSAEFLAISQQSATGPTTSRVMNSTDGTTWTSAATTQNERFRDVVWSTDLSLYSAVGEATAGTGAVISTSPDGTTWTSRTNPLIAVAGDFLNTVIWASGVGGGTGQFISGGTNNLLISANGINWTIAFTAGSSQSWGSTVAWSSSLQKYSAFIDNTIMVSTDGTTWTTVHEPVGFNSTVAWDLKWIGDVFQTFVGVSDAGVILSDDGIIWRFSNAPDPSTTTWSAVALGDSLDMIVAVDSGKLVSDTGDFVLNGTLET